MSQNFSKGKIYKISNDFNDDIYVGSTCDTLTKRFSGHKSSMLDKTKNSTKLYTLMNNVGFDRFRIELIENFPCEDNYQLRQREGYWIRLCGTLNNEIAGRNLKEWYLDNVEEKREYREQNKEHIKEIKHRNYENRKAILLVPIQCECGCFITQNSYLRHLNTKKHKELLNQQLTIQPV